MKKQWLVVYTKPRHEKKSCEILASHGIDVFLPLNKELVQWVDRKKWVEKPFFPGYLFVNIDEKEYNNVLNCKGIVRYIYHEGKPAIVRSEIIEGIRQSIMLNNYVTINTLENIRDCGKLINIKLGPFKGLSGRLVEIRGKKNIAIEIESLNKIVLVDFQSLNLN
ncbi:MAG: UpxY family transcription antiterminator [Bacteroidales bacterium]|nr:UpxY family transcription antiterminator [Bacteroidales bacterium]